MKTIYMQHWTESDNWSGKSYSFGMLYTSKIEAETKTKTLLEEMRAREAKDYGSATPESYDYPDKLEAKNVPDLIYEQVRTNQLQKVWSEKELEDKIIKMADAAQDVFS